MIENSFSDRIIIKPNTLKRLAGLPDTHNDMLNQASVDDFFDNIGTETVSVEIITLSQFKYETTFDYVLDKHTSNSFTVEQMASEIEKNLKRFDNLVPHILIEEVGILVVIDTDKVDHEDIEYVSQLLSRLPSTDVGFVWHYLEE